MVDWVKVPILKLTNTEIEHKIKELVILLSTEPYLLDDPALKYS
jgi:hypothetical protein